MRNVGFALRACNQICRFALIERLAWNDAFASHASPALIDPLESRKQFIPARRIAPRNGYIFNLCSYAVMHEHETNRQTGLTLRRVKSRVPAIARGLWR